MKKISLMGFILLISSFCYAQETASFPPENPLFTISIPESWEWGFYAEGKTFEARSDDELVGYEIFALETKNLLQAVQSIHDMVGMLFYDYDLSEPIEEKIDGILFYEYYGFELGTGNNYSQYNARLFQINEGNYFMIFYFGFPEDIERYKFDISILNNIKKL